MSYKHILLIIMTILVCIATVSYADAPPPPQPPDELYNSSRLLNLTNIVHWYYYEWWGPLSWAVVFLVPASIFIKTRSISLAVASLILLMGLLGVYVDEPYVRYVALISIAFGTAVILYRVLYNPEKQPGEL